MTLHLFSSFAMSFSLLLYASNMCGWLARLYCRYIFFLLCSIIIMSHKRNRHKSSSSGFQKYFVGTYDPLRAGNIYGEATVPHDKAIKRALTAKNIPSRPLHPRHTIFVARLDPATTETTVKEIFQVHNPNK